MHGVLNEPTTTGVSGGRKVLSPLLFLCRSCSEFVETDQHLRKQLVRTGSVPGYPGEDTIPNHLLAGAYIKQMGVVPSPELGVAAHTVVLGKGMALPSMLLPHNTHATSCRKILTPPLAAQHSRHLFPHNTRATPSHTLTAPRYPAAPAGYEPAPVLRAAALRANSSGAVVTVRCGYCLAQHPLI
jgi:hypothetical protein